MRRFLPVLFCVFGIVTLSARTSDLGCLRITELPDGFTSIFNLNTGESSAPGFVKGAVYRGSPDGAHGVYIRNNRQPDEWDLVVSAAGPLGKADETVVHDNFASYTLWNGEPDTKWRPDHYWEKWFDVMWSPNSQWFVYYWRDRNNQFHIGLADASGKARAEKLLSPDDEINVQFSGWSADSQYFATTRVSSLNTEEQHSGYVTFWSGPNLEKVISDTEIDVADCDIASGQNTIFVNTNQFNCISWAPIGNLAAYLDAQSHHLVIAVLASGRVYNTHTTASHVLYWSPDSRYIAGVEDFHENRYYALILFSRDGTFYGTIGRDIATYCGMAVPRLEWSVNSQSLIYEQKVSDDLPVLLNCWGSVTRSVVYHLTNHTAYALPILFSQTLDAPYAPVYSPDQKYALVVRPGDVKTSAGIFDLTTQQYHEIARFQHFQKLAWSPDGKTALAAWDTGFAWIDIGSWEPYQTDGYWIRFDFRDALTLTRGHKAQGAARWTDLFHEGQWISGSWLIFRTIDNGVMKLANLQNGEISPPLNSATYAIISPDGQLLLTTNRKDNTIQLVSLDIKWSTQTITTSTAIAYMLWSRDSSAFVLFDADTNLYVGTRNGTLIKRFDRFKPLTTEEASPYFVAWGVCSNP